MICDKCHGPVEVIRVTKRAAVNYREVGCRSCMEAWETVEVVDKSEPRRAWNATGALPVRYQSATGSTVALEDGPSPSNEIKHLGAALGDSRAVGGRGANLSLIPDSESESPKKPPSRRQKTALPYSGEFERFWEHTGKCRGSKGAAWRSFQDARRLVTVDQMCKAWTAYMASDNPRRGYVMNLATWLNGRGYDTEWRPSGVTQVSQTQQAKPVPFSTEEVERRLKAVHARRELLLSAHCDEKASREVERLDEEAMKLQGALQRLKKAASC